jgi:hypothetical protein
VSRPIHPSSAELDHYWDGKIRESIDMLTAVGLSSSIRNKTGRPHHKSLDPRESSKPNVFALTEFVPYIPCFVGLVASKKQNTDIEGTNQSVRNLACCAVHLARSKVLHCSPSIGSRDQWTGSTSVHVSSTAKLRGNKVAKAASSFFLVLRPDESSDCGRACYSSTVWRIAQRRQV